MRPLFILFISTLLLLIVACQRKIAAIPPATVPNYLPSQEVNINTSADIVISGTLNFAGSEQLVIIIAGSGPTDRDCNSAMGLKTNAFKMLADTLSVHRISSYRYDKRGIGKSSPVNEADLVIQDFVQDAAAIVDHFSGEFQKITLLGHSEGVLIGSMVALQKSDVEALIAVSGTAVSLDSIVLSQLAAYPSIIVEARQHINEIKKGDPLSDVSPLLAPLFRESVVPYLRSSFELDPTAEYAKVDKPVLTVGGKCDLQVPVWHAESLHAAHANSTILINNNMGHVMKKLREDCTDATKAYVDTTMVVHPTLTETIVKFLAGAYAE